MHALHKTPSVLYWRQVPEGGRVFDEGAVLVLAEGRAPLGRVEDVFGPVTAPLYALRYSGQGELPPAAMPGAQARFPSYPTNKPGRSELVTVLQHLVCCVFRVAMRPSCWTPASAGRELGMYASVKMPAHCSSYTLQCCWW